MVNCMQVDLKIIVCPNEEKNRLLKEFNSYSNLVSVKFMTKEEYLKKYFLIMMKRLFFI